MTDWMPAVPDEARPRYVAIATAIAEAVRQGELLPGDRLPTHRDLAWRLGVTVGTVTRAYREAEQRGFLAGEVGRGTFVRTLKDGDGVLRLAEGIGSGRVDLSMNHPPALSTLGPAIRELWEAPAVAELLRYQSAAGTKHHREAGVSWISRSGVSASAENVIVTAGAQHGLLAALTAVTRPGDGLLTERLTYPSIKPLAAILGLRPVGLEIDDQGVTPGAVAAAVAAGQGRVLYCTPTLHNPTAAVMSVERRQELAALVKTEDIVVIEDDVYGLLVDEPMPPLASLAPQQTIFVTGLSKTLAPGLRVGFVHAIGGLARRASDAVRSTVGMAPPLMAEVAARMIHAGQADRFVDEMKQEAASRQAIMRNKLGHLAYRSHKNSLSAWLHLPEPWRAQDFVTAAAEQGVDVTSPDHFVIGHAPAPQAVRLCLGSPATRRELDRALGLLAELLAAAPVTASPVG